MLVRAQRPVANAVGRALSIGLLGWCGVTAAGPHVYPVQPPQQPGRVGAAAAVPPGAGLTYYGGRVVSTMQVVQVIWGPGTYIPQVTSTAPPSMASFYGSVLQSPYVDWLSEYNTSNAVGPGGATTQQAIGRGTFLRQYTITPSAGNNGSTITDAQIQSELRAQIAAGHLPAPATDAKGNSNTYYAIFFPQGRTITLGTLSSCVANGFCAYHGTVQTTQGEVYYGVHPDLEAGTLCNTSCGGSASIFSNQTSVASHEMVEVITDAEVGLAATFGPPLGWYDATNNAEIGDLCNAQEGAVTGADGLSYVVQLEFSNARNACIVTTAAAPAATSGDGPLPLWALGALGAGLYGVARQRLSRAA